MKLKAPISMDCALEYLKTFEFKGSLAWGVRSMNRYTAAEVTANAALGRDICPEANRTV